MNVVFKESMDWEAAVLLITSTRPSAITIPEIEIFLKDWLLLRSRSKICSCYEKYLDVEATGYVTTAERNDDTESFREHFALGRSSQNERRSMPATVVSYLDAVEYCQWARVRLPSEAEVLAAAVVDERVRDEVDDELRRQLKILLQQGRVISAGANITSTITSLDLAVIRRGPFPFLTPDWKSKAEQHRLVKPVDFYDLTVEFHVCKP
jgi:hypothetical protein